MNKPTIGHYASHQRDVTAQEDAALNAALRSSTVKVEHPEIARLRDELAEAQEKALRFDLDSAGIERREQEATELVQLRAELAALRDKLKVCFPLLDEVGLDEEIHCCEWILQQERKRLHAALAALEGGE